MNILIKTKIETGVNVALFLLCYVAMADVVVFVEVHAHFETHGEGDHDNGHEGEHYDHEKQQNPHTVCAP